MFFRSMAAGKSSLGKVLKWRKKKRPLKLCIGIQVKELNRNTAEKKATQLNRIWIKTQVTFHVE